MIKNNVEFDFENNVPQIEKQTIEHLLGSWKIIKYKRNKKKFPYYIARIINITKSFFPSLLNWKTDWEKSRIILNYDILFSNTPIKIKFQMNGTIYNGLLKIDGNKIYVIRAIHQKKKSITFLHDYRCEVFVLEKLHTFIDSYTKPKIII